MLDPVSLDSQDPTEKPFRAEEVFNRLFAAPEVGFFPLNPGGESDF